MIRALPFILALVFSTQANFAFAAGVLENLKGDVRIDGVAAQKGDAFEPGSTITTGTDGSVFMLFDDGTQSSLTADSEFLVEDYSFDIAEPAQAKGVFNLVTGSLKWITGAIRPDAVSIKSGTATIGIRGTEFVMISFANNVTVAVQNGAVVLTNTTTGAVVSISSGVAGVVSGAAAPVVGATTALPAATQASIVVSNSVAQSLGLSVSAAAGTTGAAAGAGAAGASAGSGSALGALGVGSVSGVAGVSTAVAVAAGITIDVANEADDASDGVTATTSTTSTTPTTGSGSESTEQF